MKKPIVEKMKEFPSIFLFVFLASIYAVYTLVSGEILISMFSLAICIIIVYFFILHDVGLNDVTIEREGFYFANKEKMIKYEQVKSLKLIFDSSKGRGSSRGSRIVYYTNIEIKFTDSRRDLILSGTTHSSSLWNLVEGCIIYNESSEAKIDIGDLIPFNQEDFDNLILGWERQDSKVTDMIDMSYVTKYALDNGLTIYEAKSEMFKIKIKAVLMFIGFGLLLFILMIIYDMVS